MTHKRRTTHFIILILAALILAACAGDGSVRPQGGAQFSGTLTLERPGTNGRAMGGTIGFTLSEDGRAIAELSYELEGDVCTDQGVTVQGVGATLRQDPPPQIKDGTFIWSSEGVRVDGTFTQPTQAQGTISLIMEKEVQALGETTQISCDYGKWAWTAEAE